MATAKKREVIERHRTLLETNLVLTPDLLRWLREKKTLPEFVFEEIQKSVSSTEKNKKFLTSVVDNVDQAFTKVIEGLISNGQPFWGEFLEREHKKSSESTGDPSEKVLIDDEMLKKCPGIDKLRPEGRDRLKTYLQEQVKSIVEKPSSIFSFSFFELI